MKLKKIIYPMLGMLVFTVCLFFCSISPQAAPAAGKGHTISVNVHNGAGDAAGGMAGTGEEHVDASLDRGVGLVEGLCRAFGLIVGVIGIVLGGIGFFGHQDDMKARAPIAIGVGVLIYYAPEIFGFLVGK